MSQYLKNTTEPMMPKIAQIQLNKHQKKSILHSLTHILDSPCKSHMSHPVLWNRQQHGNNNNNNNNKKKKNNIIGPGLKKRPFSSLLCNAINPPQKKKTKPRPFSSLLFHHQPPQKKKRATKKSPQHFWDRHLGCTKTRHTVSSAATETNL